MRGKCLGFILTASLNEKKVANNSSNVDAYRSSRGDGTPTWPSPKISSRSTAGDGFRRWEKGT